MGTRPAVPGKSDTAATRGSRGRTGVFLLRLLERFQPLSDAFLLTFRVQFCKLLLVKLLDGELNGQERVQKAPVLLAAVLRDDACVLRLNESSFDQLGHIFSHGVRAHIDGVANRFVARMALIRRPILNVHQVAVDSQCARRETEGENLIRQRKVVFNRIARCDNTYSSCAPPVCRSTQRRNCSFGTTKPAANPQRRESRPHAEVHRRSTAIRPACGRQAAR